MSSLQLGRTVLTKMMLQWLLVHLFHSSQLVQSRERTSIRKQVLQDTRTQEFFSQDTLVEFRLRTSELSCNLNVCTKHNKKASRNGGLFFIKLFDKYLYYIQEESKEGVPTIVDTDALSIGRTMETMESLTAEEVKELTENFIMLLSKLTTLDNLVELLKESDGYEELRSMVDKMKRDFVGIISWHFLNCVNL